MPTALIVRAANAVGARLLEDNLNWINRIEIKSGSSTRLYIVAQRRTNGEWRCSCPSGIVRGYCKHLDAMMPTLEIATQETPKQLGSTNEPEGTNERE